MGLAITGMGLAITGMGLVITGMGLVNVLARPGVVLVNVVADMQQADIFLVAGPVALA